MLLVSITGASLITMGFLHNKGFRINEEMMLLAIKLLSFGAIFWLLQMIKSLFIF